MRLAAPFLLLAAAACAQTYEIRGVVIDAGTNHGVEGVEVTVFRKPPEAGNLPIRGCEVGKVQTDAQGAFVFRPDELREYPLTVEKPGFSPLAPGVPGAPANQLNVVLTKERPNREVRFLLGRPGEITGRLV